MLFLPSSLQLFIFRSCWLTSSKNITEGNYSLASVFLQGSHSVEWVVGTNAGKIICLFVKTIKCYLFLLDNENTHSNYLYAPKR
jgi:hypothetical protein